MTHRKNRTLKLLGETLLVLLFVSFIEIYRNFSIDLWADRSIDQSTCLSLSRLIRGPALRALVGLTHRPVCPVSVFRNATPPRPFFFFFFRSLFISSASLSGLFAFVCWIGAALRVRQKMRNPKRKESEETQRNREKEKCKQKYTANRAREGRS